MNDNNNLKKKHREVFSVSYFIKEYRKPTCQDTYPRIKIAILTKHKIKPADRCNIKQTQLQFSSFPAGV